MTRRDSISEEKLEEAVDWFLRLNEPACTKDDERSFAIWLDQAAENREAWAKACRTWDVMETATPAHAPSQVHARQAPIHAAGRRARRRMTITIGVAAIAACLVTFVAGPGLMIRYQADYATTTAEIRNITLEDGSNIALGASSAIAVHFSDGKRQIQLLSGQAYFDVQPDANRPFTVRAGELDVTAVGTAFDINITSETETVQLAHGIVNLAKVATSDTLRMTAGDTVSLDRANGRLSRTRVEIDTIATWRDRKLFVQDAPISAVIAELQRYHPSWIATASAELGARRITGLYDLSDPDRALEAVVSPYGGKVHYVSPYLRVLARF